jgi:type IV pilus assembly protein PilB
VSEPTTGPASAPEPELGGRRRRIGEVLVSQNLLTPEQLVHALNVQRDVPAGQARKRLGTVIIELGLASENQVAEALARALSLERVDLQHLLVLPDRVRLLPRALAERHGLVVLDFDGKDLTVASSDPTNVLALDDAKLYSGARHVKVLVATASQVKAQHARAWWLAEEGDHVDSLFQGVDAAELDREVDDLAEQAVQATPIVRLVDVILSEAVRAGASDVHVEPQAGGLRVRYRVDGALRDAMNVPPSARAATVSRIKIVSGLDIAERRRPQDGRAKLTVDDNVVEARVSSMPTLHGEKVVIRLLPRAENVPVLAKTGLLPSQLEAVGMALTQPQGLILITGPTGSGKTSTLYAAIQQLRTPDRNIVTLEDPVEVHVPGITQTQVNERAGVTFARGLRSILRQDPDVILVGEARDLETAELALQGSLTGHLVLTTLHTNDAVSAVTRLVDMGVDPFLVASSLSLVVAQRLLRKPCGSCAAPYVPSSRTLALVGVTQADLSAATPRRGTGCSDCGGTGYRGRTGVFEVLPVTAAMRRVLLSTPTPAAIGAAAREHGMVTLRAAALAAAARGETTYEEVLRVTHVDTGTTPRCPTCARALADDMICCPWDGALVGRDKCASCERSLDPLWSVCPFCRTAVPDRAPSPALVEPPRLPQLLVVDDDESVCQYVATALTGVVEVTAAATGNAALELLGSEHFDGAVLDQLLPDATGVELVRLIRNDPRTLTLPVLLFTGVLNPAVEQEALHAGADDFLTKPVEPMLLEERVLRLITQESRRLPTVPLPVHADES